MLVCLKILSLEDHLMQRQPATFTRHGAALGALMVLVGCQTNEPPGGSLNAQVQGESAVSTLQNINARALTCWIKSGDAEFKPYALVPELDSRANDPRILVVQRGKAQGLPQLVISASNTPVQITTFGPLTAQPISNRINADITAWSAGATGCGR